MAPVLYHTFFVNRKNSVRIRSFMFNEKSCAAAARVCSYVRVLVHEAGMRPTIDPSFFNSLECVYAEADLISEIFARKNSSNRTSLLRHIHVLSPDFADGVRTQISTNALTHVTHICGFLPLRFGSSTYSEWTRMQSSPAAWTRDIIDTLPELTHLGLILVEIPRMFEYTLTSDRFKLDALLTVAQSTLGYERTRLKQVVLHVGGRYIERRRGDIEEMERHINDSRFCVLWDERAYVSWNQWHECRNEDVMSGTDIWSETRIMS